MQVKHFAVNYIRSRLWQLTTLVQIYFTNIYTVNGTLNVYLNWRSDLKRQLIKETFPRNILSCCRLRAKLFFVTRGNGTVVAVLIRAVAKGQQFQAKTKANQIDVSNHPETVATKQWRCCGSVLDLYLETFSKTLKISSYPIHVRQRLSEIDKISYVYFAKLCRETVEKNSDFLQRIVFFENVVSRCEILSTSQTARSHVSGAQKGLWGISKLLNVSGLVRDLQNWGTSAVFHDGSVCADRYKRILRYNFFLKLEN